MRKLSLFTFISLCLVLLYSCDKDDPLKVSKDDATSDHVTETRNLNSIADSLWVEPSIAQLNLLWDDMINKATVDDIGGFLYIANADLIPELHKDVKPLNSVVQIISFLAGIGVMWALLFTGVHDLAHGHHDHGDSHGHNEVHEEHHDHSGHDH